MCILRRSSLRIATMISTEQKRTTSMCVELFCQLTMLLMLWLWLITESHALRSSLPTTTQPRFACQHAVMSVAMRRTWQMLAISPACFRVSIQHARNVPKLEALHTPGAQSLNESESAAGVN